MQVGEMWREKIILWEAQELILKKEIESLFLSTLYLELN